MIIANKKIKPIFPKNRWNINQLANKQKEQILLTIINIINKIMILLIIIIIANLKTKIMINKLLFIIINKIATKMIMVYKEIMITYLYLINLNI